MKKSALYIGRFQPFHNGHLDAIEQIVNAGYRRIIIGIGSAQEERTKKNPFTYYERKEMIENSLTGRGLEFELFAIPDFGDNLKWANYILDNSPHFDCVFSGNPYVESCFLQANSDKKFENLRLRKPVKATEIRELIGSGDDNWKSYVSFEVFDYFKNNKLELQLKKILRPMLKTPYLAVDGIVEVDGGIVLIERLNEPKGYALPGGFVDYNESCEDALIREMSEEISLNVRNLKLLGVYSEPERDSRQHVASCVYIAKSKGIPKGADDAKRAFIVPLEKLDCYELVFDHKKILDDYLEMKDTTLLQQNIN